MITNFRFYSGKDINQAVHMAEVRQRGGQCGVHIGLAGHVAVAVKRPRPCSLQFGGQGLAGGVGHVPQRHGGAVTHQAARAGLADALGGTGDHHHAPTQAEVHAL